MRDQKNELHGTRRAHIGESLARLESKGYTSQFVVLADQRLRCVDCSAELEPEEIRYVKTRRIDFETDPGQQSLLAALECPECGAKGTYTFTYGPKADANEAEILNRLQNQRKAKMGRRRIR